MDVQASPDRRIAIVGGGIAGAAAALRLRERHSGVGISLFDQSGAYGGKLRTGSLAGVTVEQGAESFLTADPAGGWSSAVHLARRVGLDDACRHTAGLPAAIATGGELTPMPAGTLMGIPVDPIPGMTAEPAPDGPLLGPGEDVAVGRLVRRRIGDHVVDRLVDPLLGGVYAGHADQLSLAVTVPRLAEAARRTATLSRAVRLARSLTPAPPGPYPFATVDGGMVRLVEEAVERSGAEQLLKTTVRRLNRTRGGWNVGYGPVPHQRSEAFDAVVLAVPAAPAARLLTGVHPDAAKTVGLLGYASVALISLAFPPDTALPELSGFLVPATEGRLIKAATFFTRKWPHLAGGPVVIRASVGRYGGEQQLHRCDEELAAAVLDDLRYFCGTLPQPIDSRVQRWGGALPQYAPGHLDRVAAVRAALADQPGLALAGAAYDGVGVPACITSGENAAELVLAYLEDLR